jgi:hypothetical protein
MTYQPNFNDPRVRARCLKCLSWSAANLSAVKPTKWAKVKLDKIFGTQNHLSAKWLRSQLLIVANNRYNMFDKICKEYLLNEQGFLELEQAIGVSKPKIEHVKTWATDEFSEELQTGEFEYTEKSHRFWHDLQRMPKITRRPLFAHHGYRYEYDIQACAPTLIYQYALRAGLTRPTPQLNEYLADRRLLRTQLTQDLGCSEEQSKRIITALFSGARLGPGNSIAGILKNDLNQIKMLSSLRYIKLLQKDIKKCWDKIKVFEGKTRLSSRDKWMIYFQLENSVITEIKGYLKKNSVRCFIEHDGWRCDVCVDPQDVRDHVKQKLNYDILIDLTIWDA